MECVVTAAMQAADPAEEITRGERGQFAMIGRPEGNNVNCPCLIYRSIDIDSFDRFPLPRL
jgi:hypothetical protein